MDFAVGGVAVAALIFGIVEAAKELGVTGKWSQALALFLGFGFVGLAQMGGVHVCASDARRFLEGDYAALMLAAVGLDRDALLEAIER